MKGITELIRENQDLRAKRSTCENDLSFHQHAIEAKKREIDELDKRIMAGDKMIATLYVEQHALV